LSGLSGRLVTAEPHWSFNASRREQPEFADEIRESLEAYYRGTDRDPAAGKSPQDLYFQEFPNFWRGYASNSDQLAIGALRISRKLHTAKVWNYVVDSHNDTSGERKRLTLSAVDDQFLSLGDDWHIRVRNCSGDVYQAYSADGRFDSDGTEQITLSVNGHCMQVAIPKLPVISYHCMFDAMPRIASDIESNTVVKEFSVLEDMQSLLGPCRVRSVETISFGPAGGLHGCCMFGRGCIPSYWWMDSLDRVVIVASTFSTLVASAPMADFTDERYDGEGSES
jgi:hypothetical protein